MPAQSGPATPVLLRGVDRAALATSLGLRLRSAGIEVGLTGVSAFARALAVTSLERRSDLYWTARVSLVSRRDDIAAFDAVFEAVFADAVLALDPTARRHAVGPTSPPADDGSDRLMSVPRAATDAEVEPGHGLPWVSLPTITGAGAHDEVAVEVPERLPSSLEAIGDIPFADLDANDLILLDGWLHAALADWPERPSRRLADHQAGRRISLRRTMAGARRTGFEPIALHRTTPTRRPRRLVMICDVSQSMQPYAAAYLHLMRAAALVTRSEVFAFSTTLTRLTSVLTHKSPVVAIEQASERVSDRFGGTRIATNLRALLRSPHGESVRGAVVLLASDGWDSDDPRELDLVMARLRRRAHRVIWMNPRAASPGFAPLVGAMAAALPHCDAMLPAHTVRELAGVVAAITDRPSAALSSRASRGSTGETGPR